MVLFGLFAKYDAATMPGGDGDVTKQNAQYPSKSIFFYILIKMPFQCSKMSTL